MVMNNCVKHVAIASCNPLHFTGQKPAKNKVSFIPIVNNHYNKKRSILIFKLPNQ
uniref:Uncharacterized protein n=1 Tax=Anguilla anguilla TaxID=7936 RepID=A0A0E9UAZ5_ANGAN